jgi:SAM-dependent methyltransferase
MRKILKYIAPKSFNDGLDRCNRLGVKLLRGGKIVSMLDAGCGDGSLTMQFANASGAERIAGIEYVDELREKAIQFGIDCRKADLNDVWPFVDGEFELIFSSQNIEHLHNTRRYLEEAYRCLRQGGKILVLTENLASWANIGSLIFGWQPFSTTNINGFSAGNPLTWHRGDPRDEEFIQEWQSTGVSGTVGHVRVLAYSGLAELLSLVGFSNIKMYTRGYLPLWGWLSDVLCSIDRRHGHFLIAMGEKPNKS